MSIVECKECFITTATTSKNNDIYNYKDKNQDKHFLNNILDPYSLNSCFVIYNLLNCELFVINCAPIYGIKCFSFDFFVICVFILIFFKFFLLLLLFFEIFFFNSYNNLILKIFKKDYYMN
eukprot:337751_1